MIETGVRQLQSALTEGQADKIGGLKLAHSFNPP